MLFELEAKTSYQFGTLRIRGSQGFILQHKADGGIMNFNHEYNFPATVL